VGSVEAHREAVRLHISRYVAVGGKAATTEVLESAKLIGELSGMKTVLEVKAELDIEAACTCTLELTAIMK
jgi:hypothetical protein